MLNYRLAFKLTDQILLSNPALKGSLSNGFILSSIDSTRQQQLHVASLIFRRTAASSSAELNKTAAAPAAAEAQKVVKEVPKTEIELRQLALVKEKQELEKAQRLLTESLQAKKAKANQGDLAKLFDSYLRLMRVDKPIGTLLCYWPSAWSILGVASYLHAPLPDFYLLGLFALGAFTMRSAGCIVNDIWDRRYDKHVERTKTRPLTSGEVGLPAAVTLLAANLSASLFVLMQLNLPTQILGACALFPVAMYPAAKRFSNWPQAYLGVTFNWGALMGWSAVMFSSTAALAASTNIFQFLPVLPLFAAGVSWTLHYDTIYGFQDKEHDRKLGLKSTSLHLEKSPKKWLLGFSSLFTTNMALFGYLTSQEPIYYITLGLAAAHLLKQIAFVKLDSPESCQKQFKSNNAVGALIALGLLSSLLIK